MKAHSAPSQPQAKERVIFPNKVPSEVQMLVKDIPSIARPTLRSLLKIALGYLQGTSGPSECQTAFKEICRELHCVSEEQVMAISVKLQGIILILKAALRTNVAFMRQDVFVADLKGIGLPDDFIGDLCAVVYGLARSEIDSHLLHNTPHLPAYKNLKWRVDVAISSSWLSRVFEPTVTMKILTDDGKETAFEVPISKFHQLRYTTANLLQQMDAMQPL